jgi:hypothetical protein
MLETINSLQQVEAGKFRGIGGQMVVLGGEVTLPEGLVMPENDNELGMVSKYLAATAMELTKDVSLNLSSSVENGKIVDKRMLAWLLMGRQQGDPGLASEEFIYTAETIIDRAVRVTEAISQLAIVQGGKKLATNWRSLFEGAVKAGVFGQDFQPTIVTSLGGSESDVPLAAPFNILPGLEVAQTMREAGFKPSMIVTSAAQYGVDCNGLDQDKTSQNWQATCGAYQKLLQEFYPEAEDSTSFETLWPQGLETYPEALVDTARTICMNEASLRSTAEQYGAEDADAFVKYMLSHTQAFRDYQATPESPFVIKVGAPSELRFSRWQKQVIEQALPDLKGFVPNTARVSKDGKAEYGQVSLYYPRIGNRPPYYSDAEVGDPTEPGLGQTFPDSFEDFLWSLEQGDPSLRRYADLEDALRGTRVKSDQYLKLFSGSAK